MLSPLRATHQRRAGVESERCRIDVDVSAAHADRAADAQGVASRGRRGGALSMFGGYLRSSDQKSRHRGVPPAIGGNALDALAFFSSTLRAVQTP